MSEEPDRNVSQVAERVKSALSDLEKDGIMTKIGIDRDAGLVKVYTEKSDALKKASAGLAEILELAYTTAEHHPYWGMLYHAAEISKILLEKWDSDLSQDNTSEIGWRLDEIRMALERAGDMHPHHHQDG
ncbi:hypothetical protein NTE_01987 [Candidatus Nitrososphaera evergladensis SR1]|uniref:Uncharacterized protein n=1 Tax=Candidatus Nitrososphaera evergladensis SR1 TaxID=1459636 RepID=A0A075MSF0_9ARCH|nr:hypothetical protein [Candidatus Nitrososphaera evergladensis]AIF84045.1 hypothetical protein NTE_01987 [Candidatus Nitrososphaera evergladensis SR1]